MINPIADRCQKYGNRRESGPPAESSFRTTLKSSKNDALRLRFRARRPALIKHREVLVIGAFFPDGHPELDGNFALFLLALLDNHRIPDAEKAAARSWLWRPRIGRTTAIAAYTTNGAVLSFEEKMRGSISTKQELVGPETSPFGALTTQSRLLYY